jgi:hypothetical protein
MAHAEFIFFSALTAAQLNGLMTHIISDSRCVAGSIPQKHQ